MVYNIDFLVAAFLFLVVILYYFVKDRALDLENNRLFLWLVVVGMGDIVLNIVSTVLITIQRPEILELTWTCLTGLFIMQILAPHVLLTYVRSYLPQTKEHRRIQFGMNVLLAVTCLLILWNRWCGIFFKVDLDGVYSRGPLYILVDVIAAAYLVNMALCSIVHRKELKKFRAQALQELLVLAVVTRVLDYVFPHVLLTGFGIALAITIMFFTLNNPYYYTDNLTNTFDVRYFREQCKNSIAHHKSFHILSVELSQIKRINLVMGAEVGTSLLIDTANMLRNSGRQYQVFRVSGKRFLVMTHNITNYMYLKNRVENYFSEPVEVQGREVKVPVKIAGIHNAQQMGSSSAILAYLDYLMTRIPTTAETGILESDEDTLKGFRYNQQVESYLEIALRDDLFELAYQPVYSLGKNQYVSVEVLSRLRHPVLGMISPDVFITIAEKNDQIDKIALLQLKKVCRFIKQNPQLMDAVQNMKLNLSPAELMKPGHAEELIGIIEEYGIPTDFFQFEITETAATEYNGSMEEVTQKFTDAGIGLCMDDFGSGYANLNTVTKLPFQVIKLDRSMLFDICQDTRTASLYQSIVYSLLNMGFHIVSEGIETAQELSMVSGWGVDMIQGYYFSRPLPAGEMLCTVVEAAERNRL